MYGPDGDYAQSGYADDQAHAEERLEQRHEAVDGVCDLLGQRLDGNGLHAERDELLLEQGGLVVDVLSRGERHQEQTDPGRVIGVIER